MRILSFDELPATAESSRALLQLAAFGSFYTRSDVDAWRGKTHRLAEYGGVFAVEGERVLGEVYVLRIPYAFAGGTEPIAGLATVTTLPDRRRRGIAAALLQDVHRREREAGLRYVTLWTNPSWGAHALYEKLGYRDVYSSRWAVRIGGSRTARRRSTHRIRTGRASDLGPIERLHDRALQGRLGFAERPAGALVSKYDTGRLDPARQLLVCSTGGRIVGYAQYDRSPQRIVCGELVARDRAIRRGLVDELLRTSGDLPCAFQHSVVPDAPEIFGAGKYARATRSWWGFMAASLEREWTTSEAIATFATDHPRFVCFAGDRF